MNLLDSEKIQAAQELVMLLAQGKFEALEHKFESALRQQLPTEKLKATWQTLEAQVGSFKEQVGAQTFQIPTAELVIVSSLSA